ncbi:MAG: Fur family transcriptional regulator [Nanobdellota archaeon]
MVINNKKRRMTNQRMKILEYLRSVRCHPTAEQVYEEVKKELPAITLATVYRNLNVLVEEGRALRFKIDNEFRFDADTENHIHFLCKETGEIYDIKDEHVFDMIKKRLGNDYSIDSAKIILRGRCNASG